MVIYTIFKKELIAYFNTLSGYLAIGLYLLFAGMYCWVLPSTNILASGYASLDIFFSISPYLLLFMVPAITMNSIAGERSNGTLLLLLIKPISRFQIILGKWTASCAICILAILPTVIYYFSVYRLGANPGNIDTGAVIGSYLGLLMLAACFAAIGIFTSSIGKNVVAAYLLGVFLCFSLYEGLNALAELPWLDRWSYFLKFVSLSDHYQAMGRGVVDSRDLLYITSLCFFFILLSRAMLLKGRGINSIIAKRESITIVVPFIALFVLNFFSASYFTRWDFTSEKRYTLSPITTALVSSLEEELYIAVFLDGDLPSGFENLKQASLDLLSDLSAHSEGKIKFSVINPMGGGEKDRDENIDLLAQRGIVPTNLQVRTEDGLVQKVIFPAAVVMYGDMEIPVNLLQAKKFARHEDALNNSIEHLEYAFANAIKKASAAGQQTVAFTEGHGELSDTALYDAMQTLSTGYLVGRLRLDSISFEDLASISVVVVARPQEAFTEYDKFMLDHFLLQGGRIIWAVSQSEADLELLRGSGEHIVYSRELNIDDLLFRYGVRFNYDLVADLNCGQIPLHFGMMGANDQIQLVPWVFYPLLVPFSPHPMVKGLDLIKTEFPGSLDTVATSGTVKKQVLLTTSPYNKLLNLPFPLSLDMAAEMPDTATFKGENRIVAALLEGKFPSAFANRAKPQGIPGNVKWESAGKKEGKIVAIADGSIFENQVDVLKGEPYPLGWDRYTEQQFGNKVFLQNMVDYMVDDAGLISLRSKELKLRLLNKVKVRNERLSYQLANVLLPILALLAFGLLQQYLRMKKYTNGKKM